MAAYKKVTVPSDGTRIGWKNGALEVPDDPIIPFLPGDGTGFGAEIVKNMSSDREPSPQAVLP